MRERATHEFRAAVRLKPELPQSHAALGTSLSHLNETDAAIEEFKAALRIDPQINFPRLMVSPRR